VSTAQTSAIDELARAERLLVAVDFDGTLSPLIREPMKARMLPEARAAVERLAALPDTVVALVSGRSLHDLREIAEHVDDSPILLAGSHGAQYWYPESGAVEPDDIDDDLALRDDLQRLAVEQTDGMEGVWIEPKSFGLGVHTRGADREIAAEANRIVEEIVTPRAPQWRRRTGHDIVEYSFRHEGKDAAIARLRERTAATAVLFAGDDVTDEDALRSLGAGDVGVRIGEGETAATVRVDDIPAFVALLDRLAESRAAQPQ
jgi:trehalose 6-phosphate phosphatase